MKSKNLYAIGVSLCLFFAVTYCNYKYEVIAFHPFGDGGQFDLKVMTWNVHSSDGADSIKQIKIVELILKEDADIVLLNEYYQDRCPVMDTLLKTRYFFTEEYQSHRRCGDIFYSKLKMSNAGHVYIPIHRKSIQTIKATIAVGYDSVQIFGVHMASNHYNGNVFEKELKNDTSSFERYKYAQEHRCFHAHWTKNAVLESKHPVIVLGDMNDFNCSAPLDTLTSCGLKDSWWEGGNGYGYTYHDGWMRLRIDHILYSAGLKLESIKVIDTNLSDHNPIIARFRVVILN